MILSINKNELKDYLIRQLGLYFPDDSPLIIEPKNLDLTLDRTEYCFSKIYTRYFKDKNGATVFNHLNSDHYSMYLYLLSNTIYMENGFQPICDKIFYLNKVMNGIDVYCDVALPEIFCFSHPIGTVMGKATYGDYFMINQNCTVGALKGGGEFPKLGEYVSIYVGASVLGNCVVGNNCKIAAHSALMDRTLADNKVYFGNVLKSKIVESWSHDYIWQPHEN